MTDEELSREYLYRVTERIGILVENGTPTQEQLDMAHREAKEAVEKLKEEK